MADGEITPETTFVAETLYTDSRVYEIVKRTPRTLTLRHTAQGPILRREDWSGGGYPQVWHEAVSDFRGGTFVVRLRKDGTYRTGTSSRPLRPAQYIDGKPVDFTDYRV
jgi:hypothetical protein